MSIGYGVRLLHPTNKDWDESFTRGCHGKINSDNYLLTLEAARGSCRAWRIDCLAEGLRKIYRKYPDLDRMDQIGIGKTQTHKLVNPHTHEEVEITTPFVRSDMYCHVILGTGPYATSKRVLGNLDFLITTLCYLLDDRDESNFLRQYFPHGYYEVIEEGSHTRYTNRNYVYRYYYPTNVALISPTIWYIFTSLVNSAISYTPIFHYVGEPPKNKEEALEFFKTYILKLQRDPQLANTRALRALQSIDVFQRFNSVEDWMSNTEVRFNHSQPLLDFSVWNGQ